MTDQEGFEDQRPSGQTVREEERRAEERRKGNRAPDLRGVSGTGTVSQKIEREMVAGGHGHGGELDREIEEIERDMKKELKG